MANRGWARVTCCWSVGSVLRHCRKPGSQLYLLCLRPPRKKDIAFHSLPDHRRCEVKNAPYFWLRASASALYLLGLRVQRHRSPFTILRVAQHRLRPCATAPLILALATECIGVKNGNNAECDEKGQKTTMNGKSDKYHKKFRKRVSI